MTPKWEEPQRMADEELTEKYDAISEGTVAGLDFYREEITRRAFERASAAAHELAAAALDEARASRRLARWNMVVAVIATVAATLALVLG